MSDYFTLAQARAIKPDLDELKKLLNEQFPDIDALRDQRIEYAGRVCAVYFLWRGTELRYVGKSTHLHARLASHLAGWPCNDWSHVTILECDEELLSSVEEHYIRKYAPPDNRQRPR